MAKYSVPVTRKVLDVYVVEARNATHAGMVAAELISNDDKPTHSHELSRTVMSAKPMVPDQQTAITINPDDSPGVISFDPNV